MATAIGKTGNINFDNACRVCEAAKQLSLSAFLSNPPTPAQAAAIDLAFYQCVVAAGKANSVNTETERLAVNLLSRGRP
jgi:hypothetical protein